MTEPAVLSKIKKLLRLATSSNPHEAALAAAKAQALLFAHKLSLVDLEGQDSAFIEQDLPKIPETWKRMLAGTLAHTHYCRALQTPSSFRLIGKPEDVQVVTYLYVYLCRTITRLTHDGWTALVAEMTDPKLGLYPSLREPRAETDWKTSFRLGAVQTIAKRLKAARAQQERPSTVGADSTALVRTVQALQKWEQTLDQHLSEKYPNLLPPKPVKFDMNTHGYHEGAAAGKKIPLRRGLGTMTDRVKLA